MSEIREGRVWSKKLGRWIPVGRGRLTHAPFFGPREAQGLLEDGFDMDFVHMAEVYYHDHKPKHPRRLAAFMDYCRANEYLIRDWGRREGRLERQRLAAEALTVHYGK